MLTKNFKTVDEYIALSPEPVREILNRMRKVIRETAPDTVESISYGMPGYKFNKRPLVYFSACKNHIGFYPTPSGVKEFQKELSKYPSSKGAVQFPLDQPIPFDLVKKIVLYRMKENLEKK